ncbi:hypothetical protein [Cellulomonas soli]|uniref:WXG100 family type VII secretion target n=1 Tax=Cellulomonas soli TaxID=931535 RepID=A0A512PFA1_9CELL|nr:hypothetical protein [Cellulomonas soli]NYI59388.1 hypothetical protein [Cellulomonas soli]GEP69822.1 hypothetical protein CSO01_25370 [Cellulomonas soli]
MGFIVETVSLRGMADSLEVRAEEASGRASEYATAHLEFGHESAGLLFHAAATAAGETEQSLRAALTAQRESLLKSGFELDQSAREYDRTDLESAARLDSLMQGSRGGRLSIPWSRAVYVEPVVPTVALTEPQLSGGGHDYLTEAVGTNWLSLSSAIDQVIAWAFDYDPLAEATKLLSGDWDRALSCSWALARLGEFERLTAANVGSALSHCLDGWSGRAADSANEYFTGYAAQLRANAEALDAVVGYFDTLHEGIIAASSTLKGLFAELIDVALVGAVSYALAVASSETVVGGVVGFIAGSAAYARVAWLARSIWDVIQAAIESLNGVVVLISTAATFGSGALRLPIPAGYSGPGLG